MSEGLICDRLPGVADGESVDYDQRGVRTVERTVAADTHYGARPGILRSVHDLQSGGTALQQSLDRRGRDVLDGIHLHGNDRSGQVALFHAAVTDDDHVVDQCLFGLEHDIEEGHSCRNGDLAGFVADESDGEHGSVLGADREITRNVGTGSGCRSLDNDAGSDERLSVGRHAPLNLNLILGGCCRQRGKGRRKAPEAICPAGVGLLYSWCLSFSVLLDCQFYRRDSRWHR